MTATEANPEDAWLVELYLAPPPFLDHISRSAKLPITEDASGEELDDRDERLAPPMLAVTSGEEDARSSGCSRGWATRL